MNLFFHVGDFHFLWECLRIIFDCYWGKTTQHGSLVCLRELISRNKVDKAVKTFSIGDEFLTHVFQAHLLVQCFKHFKVSSVKASYPTPVQSYVAGRHKQKYF